MRRSRILGASAILVMSGLLTVVLPVAAASTQAVAGRVIGSHGTLMVAASNGMTLYTFTKDVAGSGTSACTGACLTNWPALTIAAGDTPTGDSTVTGTLGTIVRADTGATQVTYNGLPLYFFAKDTKPGDTNGIYPNWEAVVLAAAATPAPTEVTATPPATSTIDPVEGPAAPSDPTWLAIALAAGLSTLLVVTRTARSRR
jgi:predicted lipoprotein with Yx(FWY)xxD motif